MFHLSADCPNDFPYCVEDVCLDKAAAEERGRNVDGGEGEGEGEGECTTDTACTGGLCYDLEDGSAYVGSCVPLPGDEDCSSDSFPARAPDGPVVFDVTELSATAGCRTLSVHFFDRAGDVNQASPLLTVGYSGTAEFPTATLAGDGTSGSLVFSVCPGDATSVGIQLGDNLEQPSNVLCNHPATAP